MRKIFGLVFMVITAGLVYLLDKPTGALPALGRLLNPVNGCWANAEPVNRDFSYEYKFPTLQKEASVWLDERLVPHIHATNNHDLYFLEGYIHATFRLWQMDMQTRAAAGRISEILGAGAPDNKYLKFDRKQRRKGMVYAAENSLKAMEADPETKLMMDAYIEGINTYIKGLKYKDYPLEYKLMGFAPEKWTNIKISLLLKYMADDLTGYTEDIPLTYLKDLLSPEQFKLFYPEKIPESSQVIPDGTEFDDPSLKTPPVPGGIIFPGFDAKIVPGKTSSILNLHRSLKEESEGIGSNNWAVSGKRTKNGASILCNDPHLALNLPSLWFEVQLQAPGLNVYGASLPGAPGVVIGFNDSIAWGCTNNARDVKDFYSIKTVEGDNNKYWFAGKQMEFTKRYERIAVKGKEDFIDSINYTIHGPVMYDNNFEEPGGYKKPLALCWMAHKGTNDLKAFYLLNRAKNYDGFVDAIMNYQCPAQNMAYADRNSNVAIWGQGRFVNKWKDQGRYIMDGSDSSTLWKEMIPMRENPHIFNPERGFVSSANQCVTDSAYPYWYNGYFAEFRAWRINQVLDGLDKATVQDMFALQNDNYSWLAASTLPVMLQNLHSNLSNDEFRYVQRLKRWNFWLDAESTSATFYQVWWYNLYHDIWDTKLKNIPDGLLPSNETTMQLLVAGKLMEDDVIEKSFAKAFDSISKLEKTVGTQWYKVKNTTVKHLAKLPGFSFDELKIGGWGNTVNAAKEDHGPSWKMVVEMGKEINAYGIYPGGQSGNPGSKYYASFLQQWVDGKNYKLKFFPNNDSQNNSDIKYSITFHP